VSYYYTYYLGYEQDKKIHLLGPFNNDHDFRCVFYRSRSFASDLHERFEPVSREQLGDDVIKEFTYRSYNDEEELTQLRMLYLDDLPSGTYMKSGYYLIEDVHAYQSDENHSSWDLFYDHMSADEFAARLQNELALGPPKKMTKDPDEYVPHSVRDYMFFAYPDYGCEEYEAFLIRQTAEMLYDSYDKPKDFRIVVLETEG
jgi:hypothetical protein